MIRGSNPTVTDSLAAIVPAPAAIGRPTATARRLVNASVSDNTRRAYAGALGQLDAWLDDRQLDDAALAAYLAELHAAGRGVESDQLAAERGRLDAVIAGLLFMGGLRRSEVSAPRWADVADAGDADGILVTVRRSKTNQAGETSDVRYLKNGHGQWVDAAPPLARAAAVRGQITMRSISSTVIVSAVRS